MKKKFDQHIILK